MSQIVCCSRIVWTFTKMARWFLIITYLHVNMFRQIFCDMQTCDRIPLGTKIDPLPPDNRFEIEIQGAPTEYIPDTKYKVRLFARDYESTFIAFTIAAKEDTKPNEKNLRRPIPLEQGKLYTESADAIISTNCNNTIIQADIRPKTSVEVTWRAPPKGNKCVILFALVAIKEGVWYKYDGPLTKKICEDQRQKEDLPPAQNENCKVCEEARYRLTLENLWLYNTHPTTYPENARISDLVGAAHSAEYSLWKYNGEATKGLKMLAEQGNTTEMEMEIQENFEHGVRTIIKAREMPAQPGAFTNANLRVSRTHHLVSFVTALLPSPDWFLGVANLELCQPSDQDQWTDKVTLNLYPLDAGTDSGMDFESPNDETSPPQPITSATIKKQSSVKPFARLKLKLIRTYPQPDCMQTTDEPVEESTQEPTEFTPPPPPSFRPDVRYPVTSEDCPMTQWEDWLPCSGECVDGKLEGFRTRIRYHIIDNVPVGMYDDNTKSANEGEVPPNCTENLSETESCTEEPCIQDLMNNITANDRRKWYEPILPGKGW